MVSRKLAVGHKLRLKGNHRRALKDQPAGPVGASARPAPSSMRPGASPVVSTHFSPSPEKWCSDACPASGTDARIEGGQT